MKKTILLTSLILSTAMVSGDLMGSAKEAFAGDAWVIYAKNKFGDHETYTAPIVVGNSVGELKEIFSRKVGHPVELELAVGFRRDEKIQELGNSIKYDDYIFT